MLRGSFALDPHLGRLQDVVIPTVIASHPILFENCNIAPAITFSNFLHIVYLADGTTATANCLVAQAHHRVRCRRRSTSLPWTWRASPCLFFPLHHY